MPIQNTITIAAGPGTPVSLDYEKAAGSKPGESVWYADSPHGDLRGRPLIRVGHVTTRADVDRSLVSFVEPVLNVATGLYDSSLTVNCVIQRKGTAQVVDVATLAQRLSIFFSNATIRDQVCELDF